MVGGADGALLARAPLFSEPLLVHALSLPAGGEADDEIDPGVPRVGDPLRVERLHLPEGVPAPAGPPVHGGVADRVGDEAEVWQALVLGLRDYVRKNGFPSVVIALSGGIDSAVVAAIACDAVGADSVVGVSMPSSYSSQHSRDDAADLAKRTGLDYRVEPIQPMVDAFLANMSLSGLAVENLQARVRGVILMALSNQEGHLVLTTGNKSELAVGYSTLYGDSVGGFNPVKDVFKTRLYALARWRDEEAVRQGQTPPAPRNSILQPPSAELRPGPLVSHSLPGHPVLDALP